MGKSRQGSCPRAARNQAGEADVNPKIHKLGLRLVTKPGVEAWGSTSAMSKNIQVVEYKEVRVS